MVPFASRHDLLTWAIEYKFIAALRTAHFDLQRLFRRTLVKSEIEVSPTWVVEYT